MPENIDDLVLLSGRYFTLQELLEVQETARMFPKLSRAELANTICENLSWVTQTGDYKTASCLQLFDKLEGRELITLPAKKNTKANAKRDHLWAANGPGPAGRRGSHRF